MFPLATMTKEADALSAFARQLRDCLPIGVHTRRTSSPPRILRQPGLRHCRDRVIDRPGTCTAPVSRRGAFLSAPPNLRFSAGGHFSSRWPSCCHTPTARKIVAQSGPVRRRTGRCGCSVPALSGTFLFLTPLDMTKESTTNRPWKVLRSSGVSASIFANSAQTKDGDTTYYKVSLTRNYRDGDEWKSTTSLSREDLPTAALLLQQAWVAIVTEEADD